MDCAWTGGRSGRCAARSEGGRVSPTVRSPFGSRAEATVAIAFGVAAVAGLCLLIVYALGGQTQIEGVLLMLSLGGIAVGIVVWGHELLPDHELIEEREPLASPSADEDDPTATVVREGITRRRALLGMLGAAFGGLAAALAIPVLSLGPAPGSSLFETPWKRGLRLVGPDGAPVNADDLPVEGVLTVFPEGFPGSADGQTLLIRVDPGLLELPSDRAAWAPDGYVAYSKVCTHAGCPVALYRANIHSLICPCHQSTFDVLRGAVPTFGPAVRPLPQLPIQRQADGTFVALGDFPAPIGPSFWNVHSGSNG
ncbi:MAG TPA: Rieske 2Fe-2S domain-containing protein [Candidatus Limnocylindrales bacterium]|nr:Rieske 2Fe-2S domain-containing protein [Candidatus Limnocylindrales bacterium]